jgi:hypothetical protein
MVKRFLNVAFLRQLGKILLRFLSGKINERNILLNASETGGQAFLLLPYSQMLAR